MIGLTFFSTFIEQFFVIFIVFIMIIFQNEIRRSSEKIRRVNFFYNPIKKQPLLIKRILQSVEFLSKNKIGALIVAFEQDSPLDEYTESGISINANLTSELICSLFWPGSPTHDGAIIIRGNEILTAGCLLPLTSSQMSDKRLGTRHMSAIGISEETDALVIVVSEETGTISIAEKGNLTRFLNREAPLKQDYLVYIKNQPHEHCNLEKKYEDNTPITLLTAYDATMARLIEMSGIDGILVGDSLRHTFYGDTTTVKMTLQEMIYHTKAVCNGVKKHWLLRICPL